MAGESQQLPEAKPDPTVITTEIIGKEVHHLRELLETQIQATDAMCAEKFTAIAEELANVERQRLELKADTKETRVEQKRDTKDAVDAAFAAAKEAVEKQTTASALAISKSEAATAKELAQLSTTFGTALAGVLGSIDDIKERVGKIENVAVGGTRERAEFRQSNAATVALIGLIVTVVVALIAVAGFVLANAP